MWISGSTPHWRRNRAKQRRRGRAIDIVVAEDRDRLAAHDGVGEARRRLLHAGEHVRIGHRAPDRRIEKGLDGVDLDIAAGNNARQQFGQFVALRDRQRARRGALVEPVAPSAAGRRIFDAEEQAIVIGHCPVVIPGRADQEQARNP